MLSLKSNYDLLEHIRAGEAQQPLRYEGILIIGSGLTYHNMRGFCWADAITISEQFEQYLNETISDPNPVKRVEKLIHWEKSAVARLDHPRENHLIPLMVIVGAAGDDVGSRIFCR